MSHNDVLDVGLGTTNKPNQDLGSEFNDDLLHDSINDSLFNNDAKTAVVNPYKFSERHLLDERKGLDKLSLKVQESMKTISKKKTNDDIYDEIVKTYRLWTHELNPKYKLKDTITLINRVGKSRDILDYRRKKIDDDSLSKLKNIEKAANNEEHETTEAQND